MPNYTLKIDRLLFFTFTFKQVSKLLFIFLSLICRGS